MNEERVKLLKDLKRNKKGKYVLYWMQQSQRTEYNHALDYAIEKANKFNLPLVVCFGVTAGYPEANERHYYFMLEGLAEVKRRVEEIGGLFVIRKQSPERLALELSKEASITVADKGYMKIQKKWRGNLVSGIGVPLVEVESDLIVPIEVASNKEEYAAYTIRKKINRVLGDFFFEHKRPELKVKSASLEIESLDLEDIDRIILELDLDRSVKRTRYFSGGYSEARRRLEGFIDEKLNKYNELRNNPGLEYTSTLSPYLHFGQISPLEIALEVKKSGKSMESVEAYLEELIVRRELAFNFCYYNDDYDSYQGLKANWIYETLEKHKMDEREYIYSRKELEEGLTHDEIWNACQKELRVTGDMHGYMRMYWGKKILEWSVIPEEAFETAVYLNNKYALDGRDANSFTGIAWCFGKHDRPWFERDIFGKVRYMNASGLKRKFKVEEYLNRVKKME